MDLLKKIIIDALKTDMLAVSIGGEINYNEMIESKSYEILMQIKAELENMTTEDF